MGVRVKKIVVNCLASAAIFGIIYGLLKNADRLYMPTSLVEFGWFIVIVLVAGGLGAAIAGPGMILMTWSLNRRAQRQEQTPTRRETFLFLVGLLVLLGCALSVGASHLGWL